MQVRSQNDDPEANIYGSTHIYVVGIAGSADVATHDLTRSEALGIGRGESTGAVSSGYYQSAFDRLAYMLFIAAGAD